MKKIVYSLLIVAMCTLLFSACGSKEKAQNSEQTEIVVFAAASMTEALDKIIISYKDDSPNVTVTPTYDSSGTLKTQIESGADCQLFISAGQKQMNQLDISADSKINTKKLDFIIPETRVNILENKIVLINSSQNKTKIASFDKLADSLKSGNVMLSMGNSDVPAGQYAQKILSYYHIDEKEISPCISYSSNVKEIVSQVKEGAVDCGIVYSTDAHSAGLDIADYATAEMCGQIIYPAALIRGDDSNKQAAAQEFLNYLASGDAKQILQDVGFTPIN